MGNNRNKIKKRRNWRIENAKNMNKILKKRNILKKLNLPPTPALELEVEPEVNDAPSPAQSVEVTGPRSCRLQRCAFSSCPNSAPSAAEANDGITFYPFPRNPRPAGRWARRVARDNGEQFYPRMSSRVCALHFPPTAGGALDRDAVPTAEPYRELEKIEEVLLPNGDTNERFGSLHCSEDLVTRIDINDESPVVKQAVASLVDIPPPENGIKLQCVNVENKNATVHYLSVDKDYTVNHTHVNINKNNIATLHYVDTKSTVNHTLKCISLNEDKISSYEALMNPNITQTPVMKIEIVPNQNGQENGFDIKINSKLVGENNMTPDEEIDETIQNTLTDNLDTNIRVKSEDCNSDEETEEIIIGLANTSECDNDFDETVVVKMEYESDGHNDL